MHLSCLIFRTKCRDGTTGHEPALSRRGAWPALWTTQTSIMLSRTGSTSRKSGGRASSATSSTLRRRCACTTTDPHPQLPATHQRRPRGDHNPVLPPRRRLLRQGELPQRQPPGANTHYGAASSKKTADAPGEVCRSQGQAPALPDLLHRLPPGRQLEPARAAAPGLSTGRRVRHLESARAWGRCAERSRARLARKCVLSNSTKGDGLGTLFVLGIYNGAQSQPLPSIY